MHCFFSPDSALHAPAFELIEGQLVTPHESQQRVEMILGALEHASIGPIVPASAANERAFAAVHSADYLEYLRTIYPRWVEAGGHPGMVLADTLAVRWMRRPSTSPLALPGYYAYDMSSAIVEGTYQAVCASASTALAGARLLAGGARAAYALCRPPGHHAGTDLHGGYCYLNNAAIAAQYLRDETDAASVAILDIDFHHGNGTQQIFYERADVLTVSLHGHPDRVYPYFLGFADEQGSGPGEGFNLNIPLDKGTTNEGFLAALQPALARIASFGPRFLVVSAGFDTFGGDPLGDFALTGAAYPAIGAEIARLGLPTLFVQEGGYAVHELGANVCGLLAGFEAAA